MNKSITLPDGWKWSTLGESFTWSSGGTPLRSKSEYYGGDVPWAIIGDLNDGIIKDTKSKITLAGLRNSSAKWVEEGSVLLAMYGSIGKLGIAGIRLTTNQAIAFTKPEKTSAKYLFYYLMGQRKNLLNLGMGATQQNISQTIIKAYPFPIAPQDKQERIVAKIEELFTQLDAGTAALKHAQAGLKRYKASVLKAAVEGRLVPQDPSDEPACELLKRIGKEPTKCAELPLLPTGWEYTSWQDLLSLSQNGFGKRRSDSGTPTIVLRLADIHNGFISRENIRRIKTTNEEIIPYILLENDLLCIRVNGSIDKVGRLILCDTNNEPTAFCDHFIRFRLVVPEMASFYQMYFETDRARKFIEMNRVSSAGQNTISQSSLSKFLVPVPPIAEQTRIINELTRQFSIIHEIEQAIIANFHRSENFRKSILNKAFEGTLV